MTNDIPDSPSLLIAMVSRDVIVLAKLIRTLCPQRVLLFCTAHARSQGWVEPARRLLAGLAERRPEIVRDFAIVELPDEELPARLKTYGQQIAAARADIGERGARVYFDCTTGQSIFHVVGFDLLKAMAGERGLEVGAVYCDADTGTLLRSTQEGGDLTHAVQSVAFRFAVGQELTERFEMYGVTTRGGSRLWPITTPSPDAAALLQLYDALLEQAPLRAVFHSYQLKQKRWKLRQKIGRDHPGDAIRLLAGARIADLATRVCARAGAMPRVLPIREQLEDALVAHVGRAGDTLAWLDIYLRDKRLTALQTLLLDQTAPLPSSLAPGRDQGLLRQTLREDCQLFATSLIQELCQVLGGLARSPSQGHAHSTPRDRRNWLASALQAIPLPAPVVDLLLVSGRQLPYLFEDCIGQATARLAADALGDRVAAVYRNLILDLSNVPVAELDTLILSRDGGVAVVEVKTHRASADHKKIESNIKQVRDFGGAFSAYRLVYPLTAAELEGVRQGRPATLDQLQALGMEDLNEWQGYLLAVERSRDQRVLGLDQLREAMGG